MNARFRFAIIGVVVIAVLGILLFRSGTNKEPLAITTDGTQTNNPEPHDSVEIEKDREHIQAESIPIPEKSELPRLLELGSVGCRPCDMMAPILAELTKEYTGMLSVEFYDVRKDPSPARQYRIRLIPTQIFLDSEGKEFFRHEGYFSKEQITAVLDQMGVTR